MRRRRRRSGLHRTRSRSHLRAARTRRPFATRAAVRYRQLERWPRGPHEREPDAQHEHEPHVRAAAAARSAQRERRRALAGDGAGALERLSAFLVREPDARPDAADSDADAAACVRGGRVLLPALERRPQRPGARSCGPGDPHTGLLAAPPEPEPEREREPLFGAAGRISVHRAAARAVPARAARDGLERHPDDRLLGRHHVEPVVELLHGDGLRGLTAAAAAVTTCCTASPSHPTRTVVLVEYCRRRCEHCERTIHYRGPTRL